MSNFLNPLNGIKIASPCSADWNEMVGDGRKRYCGDCQLNVYNLSEMTQTEAEDFILESEGRICVRFYRRTDGTILTKDCPVGWQKIKNRTKVFATATASVLFSFFGAIGLNSLFGNNTEKGAAYLTLQEAKVSQIEKNSEAENKRKQFSTMGNFSVTDSRQVTLSNGGMTNTVEVGAAIKIQRER